jgi:hypothetical protein
MPGFRRDVRKICAFVGYYAALSRSSVPTFRDNISVPSSMVKKSLDCALLGYYAALSGSSVPTFRDNISIPSSRVKKSLYKSQAPGRRCDYILNSGALHFWVFLMEVASLHPSDVQNFEIAPRFLEKCGAMLE